jgi:G3E family GTPase
MNKTKLILLSGFLGAGKTTLMLAAAGRLRQTGIRVACITNDQGGNLVDSKMVLHRELPLQQIQGGCFCCRFEDLVEAIGRILSEDQAGVIIAEAVGSCTDLMATVVKPLQMYHADKLDVRPLTVVVDPKRWSEHMAQASSPFTGEISYLYEKQLEEAQCIVVNKTDLLSLEERNTLYLQMHQQFDSATILDMSAYRLDEVDHWLSHIVNVESEIQPSIDIDYDLYAKGEAQLGWLNANLRFKGLIPHVERFCGKFTDQLMNRFRSEGTEVAHLKLWVQSEKESLKLSAVQNAQTFRLDHTTSLDWSATEITMWVNARVNSNTGFLRETVTSTVGSLAKSYGVNAHIEEMDCFSPSRPIPVHRMA